MKKQYRIELRVNGGLASELANLAALSNGSGNYLSLMELAAYAKTEMIRFTGLNDGVTVSIIGDNILVLDKKTEPLLCLTEIEITELAMPEITADDARDILANQCPTVFLQDRNN